MIKYSQLIDKQKQAICNGCGGKGGLINPPDFIFKASCNQHDFYYWRGGLEYDRLIADYDFYKDMLEDIETQPLIKKPYYHLWALAYYKAVRIFGKKYFNYNIMKNETDLKKF